ncbi:MAG: hypothetical protein FJ150_08470 [Euryarchaeota archaeon]|nr:hypothetical protein [Euryarchaeota archaeon]
MKWIDLKKIIPFIPLITVFILLILKPYYLAPTSGDLDFHLVRAREIIENPLYGLFWNYSIYYPVGRALWHPPLFHSLFALAWYIGGVRFAHSIFCILQIILTVGVASWFANKNYGMIAGLFSGIFALSAPLPDTLYVAMPATYIPILAILTIYFLPKDKTKAFITSLIGLWTHIIGLIVFIPLFLVDSYKNRENLIAVALLLPSWFLWIGYLIYFKNQTGAETHMEPSFTLFSWSNVPGLWILLILGLIGILLLYKVNVKQFKLISTYLIIVIMVQFFFGDISRGLQYAALPLAILSGLTVQKGYEYLSQKNRTIISIAFIASLLIFSIIGSKDFIDSMPQNNIGWSNLNIPFENEYAPLKDYIERNTNKNDVVWADSEIADKVAWMTGRRVSNGRYGTPPGFIEKYQKINIHILNKGFLIKDFYNETLIQI